MIDFNTENYKTSLREIKENLSKWRDMTYLLVGKFNAFLVEISEGTWQNLTNKC